MEFHNHGMKSRVYAFRDEDIGVDFLSFDDFVSHFRYIEVIVFGRIHLSIRALGCAGKLCVLWERDKRA